MEAHAMNRVFGAGILYSPIKSMTGHMQGAAGANEVAFLWLMLEPDFANGVVPRDIWARIHLTAPHKRVQILSSP